MLSPCEAAGPRHPALVITHSLTAQSLNPGNLASDLQRHLNWIESFVIARMTYPPVNGAYTELYAGLSPDIAAIKPDQWGTSSSLFLPMLMY